MERFQYLFNSFVNKTATSGERLEFQEMLRNQKFDAELKKLIDFHFAEFEPMDQIPELRSSDRILQAVILANKQNTFGKLKSLKVKLWPKVAIAVSATIALIFLGNYFFNYNHQPLIENSQLVKQDVAPGSIGATLTLANGIKIKLSESANGQLAKEAGVLISKTSDGKISYQIQKAASEKNNLNILSTAKGESYQVRLPDGSTVWLNSASSLKYPASFAKLKTRLVELKGEAYFEVIKDKKHPFIVKTTKQEVKVLGTHFNINSYDDEPITKTTLLEGSVQINKTIVLKPGEQAINSSAGIKVKTVDADNAIGWKNGDFVFNEESFGEAIREISRWYNVDIVYDGVVATNILPGGWISRKNNISVVLKRMEAAGQMHFKIEGRRITITE